MNLFFFLNKISLKIQSYKIKISFQISTILTFSLINALYFGIAFFSKNLRSEDNYYKELKYEVKSKYSHIKVYDEKSKRFLCFVRDNGDEVVESSIDIKHPEELQLKYTQAMFGAYLLNKKLPQKTLMIGLGGGGMPLFNSHYFPEVEMKIVELDPEIVKIAKSYFYLTEKIQKNIIIEDAFTYLKNSNQKFDIIFMDAFLKPSRDTDETGVSYKFKEKAFYNLLLSNLNMNGIVVFNINHHSKYKSDLESISGIFPSIYVINRKNSGNYIVVASTSKYKIPIADLKIMAEWIDRDRKPNYSFVEMLGEIK